MCLNGFCIPSVPLLLVHLSVELLVLSHLGVLYIPRAIKVANILFQLILLLCLVLSQQFFPFTSIHHFLSAFWLGGSVRNHLSHFQISSMKRHPMFSSSMYYEFTSLIDLKFIFLYGVRNGIVFTFILYQHIWIRLTWRCYVFIQTFSLAKKCDTLL